MLGDVGLNDIILNVAAIALSLLFEYVPPLKQRFDGLSSHQKPMVMLGLVVVVTAALTGVSCLDVGYSVVTCDKAGMTDMVKALFTALISNQVAHLYTKRQS